MSDYQQLEFSDIKRKYEPHFPLKRLLEIREMIMSFKPHNEKEQRDRAILYALIFEGKTTREIFEEEKVFSNRFENHKRVPLSQRQIQNIIAKYIPDYRTCRKSKKPTTSKARKEQKAIKQEYLKEGKTCAVCGSTENLELHHMIPLDMGGTNDAANLIILCKYCHFQATKYYMENIKSR